MLIPMNEKEYSEHWDSESNHLERQGIYERLNQIAPIEDTVEIGCGAGVATQLLAATRKVLSIDNNLHLIEKAKSRLKSAGLDTKIIHTDLFDLSHKDIQCIKDFSPKGIVGWFIGSHPYDVEKRTPSSTPINEKSKKYRESIEDLIVSKNICLQSVEWIHLANRGGTIESASANLIFEETKKDYDTHVLSQHGFAVVDVQVIPWDREGSNFMYITAPNPNLMAGQSVESVVSILARRIDSKELTERKHR